MKQLGRPGLTLAQKKDLWRRWKEGQSLSDIGRALGKHPGSIHGVVKANGGIVPAERTRAARTLALAEREEISRGLAHGESVRSIAGRLGRAPSTVSREINRHGGRRTYRAVEADGRAWNSARRPKTCRLAQHPELRDAVAVKLAEDWSPEQISGWLVNTFPDEEAMRVSAETIYRSLFLQARGVLRKELVGHLRRVRTMRSSKNASTDGQGRAGIIDAVSIRDRPAQVEDWAVPGHWEGDLISGSNNSHIATLVERRSRFVMLVKVDGKDTDSVVGALTRHVRQLPEELMRSLTWDRGMELAAHKRFTVATDVQVYFADPRSPWQRGSNENTNGLLRQYFPKGTPLSGHSQEHLNDIAMKLNTRPRKTLGFDTPAAKLTDTVALTGWTHRGLLREESAVTERYELIAAEKADATVGASVGQLCSWSGVSTSGFYDWAGRSVSARARARVTTATLVAAAFEAGRGAYGARRVRIVLRDSGHPITLRSVRSHLRELGLRACQPRAHKLTTVSDADAAGPIDRVRRDFSAPRPGVKLVGDITYIRTGQGWLYLATAIDCYSKMIVGWSMAEHMRTSLVTDAIDMAAARSPLQPGCIFHSDRGTQYTSAELARHLKDLDMLGSMGRTGVCWDNAMAESFFSTLKNELVNRTIFGSQEQARSAIAEYIEVFYNRDRLHSGLGYRTPAQMIAQWQQSTAEAA